MFMPQLMGMARFFYKRIGLRPRHLAGINQGLHA
jgi:hypothetical protein